MDNPYLIEVDESVERALRDERGLGGKFDLLADMNRGTHARAVIAEMNHQNQLKALGEQTYTGDDFEMRLEGVLHGNGFHNVAQSMGTYDVWDPGQSDYLDFIKRRFPENNIRVRARKTTIVNPGLVLGSKYGPPRL